MTALGVLGSYALEGRGASYERARRLIAAGFPFVWDSGAWSVFTGAAEVDVEGHAGWVLQQPADPGVRFVALDVIGDPDATLANYRAQREAGARVEPTVHYGEPLDQVERLLAVGDTGWLNVGGIVGALARPSEHRNVAAFIAAVRRRLPPEVKVHALGCIHPGIAQLVPFEAADSTYWLNVVRFRSLSLFDDRRGDWRKFSACTTTRDHRRDHTWRTAFGDGSWLRDEYDLDPRLIAAEPDDDRLLRAAIDAHERFARWATALLDRPVFIYLAGAVSSDILLDRLPEGARS